MPKQKKPKGDVSELTISEITKKTLNSVTGVAAATFIITKIIYQLIPKHPNAQGWVGLGIAVAVSVTAAHYYKPATQKDRHFLGVLNGILVFCTVSGFTSGANLGVNQIGQLTRKIGSPTTMTLPKPGFFTPWIPDPATNRILNNLHKSFNSIVDTQTDLPHARVIAQSQKMAIEKSPYYKRISNQ